MPAFDRDTAVQPLGDGRYRVRFDPSWRVVRGPNGGYVGAVLVRAIRAAVDDPARPLRSLTVHYTSVPAEDEAVVTVRVERTGRGLTTVTARCEQQGRLVALALAALAGPYPAVVAYADGAIPHVPRPEELSEPDVPEQFRGLRFREHFELRPALGFAPLSGAERAHTGGWIRLREPRPLDDALLVALSDAWWPAPYSVADQPFAAPTIDLTVHVRAQVPREHDWVLIDVRSQTAQDGFLEEDTRIFARDGTLLSHSRQLALAL